jgi:hypothetical protein
MKRSITESIAAVWVALTEVLEPHQRWRAARVLADALDDDEFSDPLARCFVRSLVKDAAENFEPAVWHAQSSAALLSVN